MLAVVLLADCAGTPSSLLEMTSTGWYVLASARVRPEALTKCRPSVQASVRILPGRASQLDRN